MITTPGGSVVTADRINLGFAEAQRASALNSVTITAAGVSTMTVNSSQSLTMGGEIPTLSEVGLAGLAVVLAMAGMFVILRRRSRAATA